MQRVFHWALLAAWCAAGNVHAKKAAPCTPKATIHVNAKGVRALTFSRDGRALWTGNEDGTLRLVNVAKRKAETTLAGHKGAVYAVAISPDGKTVASGSEDKSAMLWDVRSRKSRSVLQGHLNTIRSVAFGVDGSTLFTASLDRQLGQWDVRTGKLDSFLGGQACILNGVAVSRGTLKDGAGVAATACNDGLVRVWNLRTGKPAFALEGHEGEVHAVAFAPRDGNPAMASGDNESKVIVWDVQAKTSKVVLENVGWTDAVTFSPDGTLLATAGNDGAGKGLFKLFDPATGKMVTEQFPHEGNVPSVAFSPDGKWLATGGMDETIKLWDVKQLHKGCDP
jgi:WD40 repeat protein